MTADAFDAARFYDIGDHEELSETDPEEAIETWFGNVGEPGQGPREIAEQNCPVTVTAHNPRPLDPSWAKAAALNIVDRLDDEWCEEYSDPEHGTPLSDDKRLVPAITAAIRRAIKKVGVWQCEEVAERTYSAAEVLAIVGEEPTS